MKRINSTFVLRYLCKIGSKRTIRSLFLSVNVLLLIAAQCRRYAKVYVYLYHSPEGVDVKFLQKISTKTMQWQINFIHFELIWNCSGYFTIYLLKNISLPFHFLSNFFFNILLINVNTKSTVHFHFSSRFPRKQKQIFFTLNGQFFFLRILQCFSLVTSVSFGYEIRRYIFVSCFFGTQ